MTDCKNIQKITLRQLSSGDGLVDVVLYFNVKTNKQISEKEAQLCPNISAIEINCAKICKIN